MRKRLVLMLCAMLALIAAGAFPRAAGAAGGLWTDTDAVTGAYLYADFSPFTDASLPEYRVSTPAQLAALSALAKGSGTLTDANGVSAAAQDFSGKTVLLTGDVDLSAHGWYPIGIYNTGFFQGTFNGQNHAVSGMAVDVTAQRNAMGGLFGQVRGALIQNIRVSGSVKVTLENATGSDTTTAFAYAGGVVGQVNDSTISSCAFTGTVEAQTTFTGGTAPGATGGRACAGGIAGTSINDGVTIANCGVTASTIRADAAEFNSLIYAHAGGVAGYCVGGLAIENCYAAGVTVTARENPSIPGSHSGGILGEAYNGVGGGLSNSYYQGDLAFLANNVSGSLGSMPVAGNVKFTGAGSLASPGYGGQTSLLAALNAWVNAKNAAGGSYLTWAQGSGLPYHGAYSAPAAQVPKTGDDTPLTLLWALPLLSGAGLIVSRRAGRSAREK